jgi:hypothetical protein
MLYAITYEDAQRAVVHAQGNFHAHLPEGHVQQGAHLTIQAQAVSRL